MAFKELITVRSEVGVPRHGGNQRSNTVFRGHFGRRRRKMDKSQFDPIRQKLIPWNADRIVGAKRPLKPRDVWAIRFYLDQHHRRRDRALFDLAFDSKLRGCDVVKLKIGDVVAGGSFRNRATVIQQRPGSRFNLNSERMSGKVFWPR
jgi:hypothetical protein